RPEASKSHPGSSWPRGDRRRRVVPAPLPRAGRDHDPRSQAPAARDRAAAGALSGGRAAALPPRGGRAADEARQAEGQAADREGDRGPLPPPKPGAPAAPKPAAALSSKEARS